MERNSAEEDSKHGDPFQVFPKCAQQGSVLCPVSDHGEAGVTSNSENEDDGDIDLEAVDVIVVERAIEEANEEIVENREEPGRSEGVIGTDIGHDSELRRKRNIGEDEGKKEAGEGALPDPLAQRIKDELVATVSVPVYELAPEDSDSREIK
jgi:hypothetical protein